MKFFQIILLLSLPTLFISCSPEEIPDKNDDYYFNCHLEQAWANSNIKAHLVGKWRWIYKKCPGAEEGQDYLEYKGQIIEFKDDSTLEIFNDGEAPVIGTYSIKTNGNYYGLNTTPKIPSIVGRIFFCYDEMEANQSLINGCSNYLRKSPY